MSDLRARRARLEDVDAIGAGMKLVVDEGGLLATQPPVEASDLADRFREALERGHVVLVLEAGEDVVGALGLHPAPADGVVLLGMWIVKQHRGQGGGRMLVEAALRAAAETGVHKVELEVYPDNGRAIALYAAMGFAVEGVRRDHYRRKDGSLRSSIIMARLLCER